MAASDWYHESLEAHPRSLVHGDFSPKNLLVSAGGLMMVEESLLTIGLFWKAP